MKNNSIYDPMKLSTTWVNKSHVRGNEEIQEEGKKRNDKSSSFKREVSHKRVDHDDEEDEN